MRTVPGAPGALGIPEPRGPQATRDPQWEPALRGEPTLRGGGRVLAPEAAGLGGGVGAAALARGVVAGPRLVFP